MPALQGGSRQSSMLIYAFLFGSLLMEGDALLLYRSSDVLYTPDGYVCQVRPNESFLYAAFPAKIPFNNSDLKGNFLEFRRLYGDSPEKAVRFRL